MATFNTASFIIPTGSMTGTVTFPGTPNSWQISSGLDDNKVVQVEPRFRALSASIKDQAAGKIEPKNAVCRARLSPG